MLRRSLRIGAPAAAAAATAFAAHWVNLSTTGCRGLEEEKRTQSGPAQLPPVEEPPSRDPLHLEGDHILERAADNKPVFIGIAGGTGSGKTTVAKAIADRLGPQQLVHISHDSYYKDQRHLPFEQRGNTNFDHPDALDSSLLVEHLDALKRGEVVEIPVYDYATHTRVSSTTKVAPKRIVLVEGILIFSHPELVKRLDIKIFVDTDSDVRFIRRLRRDIKDRGRDVESVIAQYTSTVRPMHEQFVEPTKRVADVIIPTGLNSVALEMVIARLELLCQAGSNAEA